MTFTPTSEQLSIIAAARETQDNLLINARAGAAKTSTLVLLGESLPHLDITSLAFNVAIKKEMEQRMPSNCRALTLNGLGHRAWGEFLCRRLTLDKDKTFRLLKNTADSLQVREKKEASDTFAENLRIIRFAKSCGFVPMRLHSMVKPLMEADDFFNRLDEAPSELQERLVTEVLRAGFKEAMNGMIDFDDQILMPAVMPVDFVSPKLTLVDESQDLSAINHVLLRKLTGKHGRVIAVGDPCQAIYGFRGAHEESMALLKNTFSMEEFYLTISFRCPQAVVREARWRAADMKWPEWALEGEVRRLEEWGPDDLPDGAAIICRNNAPIFSLAFRLLRAGRYPELTGNDIMKGLLKLLRKFGPDSTPKEQVLASIAAWYEQESRRTRVPASLEDRRACLEIMAEQGETLGEAIAWAEHLEKQSGRIKLMTGHKSKGLEFHEVFFLDQYLVGKDGQDPNLRYVIQTRAKHRLTYIDTIGYGEAQ